MPTSRPRPTRRTAAVTILSLGAGLALLPAMSATALAPAPGCTAQPTLGLAPNVAALQIDGCEFKDLNRDGALQPYEDWRLPDVERAADLVERMTVAQKAGFAFHASLPSGEEGYDLEGVRELVVDKGITSAITRYATEAGDLATAHNELQQIAERETPLGVPLTISTDPRNGFGGSFGTSVAGVDFSKWPEQNGFGAIDDVATTEEFADIARQEYIAVGINMTLSPMADLATDPRWGRTYGTFGSDSALVDRHTEAYITGFQGGTEGAGEDSIATVVKHWAGYGAPYKGIDGHNTAGRYATFQDQASLDNHLSAFDGAFEVQAAGVMPTYSVLVNAVAEGENDLDEADDEEFVTPLVYDGQTLPFVGGAYSAPLVNDLLREERNYTGVVVSDWGILNSPSGQGGYGTAFGVNDLTQDERVALAMTNGVDQFGGGDEPESVLAALESGELDESVLDATVVRVLEQKLRQGLFENPYVDPEAAAGFVGNPEFQASALDAQERSLTLLQNTDELLPIAPEGTSIWPLGVDPAAVEAAGFSVAESAETADVALVRVGRTGSYADLFAGTVHPLDPAVNAAEDNGAENYTELTQLPADLPRVVTIELDRALVLDEVAAQSTALVANYGVSDEALLNVVSGAAAPEGTLPYELPSSQEAAELQQPDLADDSVAPLYEVGFGLAFAAEPTDPGEEPAPSPEPSEPSPAPSEIPGPGSGDDTGAAGDVSDDASELNRTGTDATPVAVIAAAALLLLGVAVVAVRRIARRS